MIALLASTLVMCLFPALLQAGEPSPRYAVALSPTPVLNSPVFREVFGGRDGNSLKTDKCGQIRELEFIAFLGSRFTIHEEIAGTLTTIYRVTTTEYAVPSGKEIYIDSRFVQAGETVPGERKRALPAQEVVLGRLRSSEGTPYVWGGNAGAGIAELPKLYPPKDPGQLSSRDNVLWRLAGVDCSGLLYEATDGWTPRNSSDLVRFGTPVAIKGLSADAIAQKIRPLDLIVWPGHILVALENDEVIESRLSCDGRQSGVVIRPLMERLLEIVKTRAPLDSLGAGTSSSLRGFVVRRWHVEGPEGAP